MKITYVTGNWAKIESARYNLEPLGIEVVNIKMETPEIQADDVTEVSMYSAKWAAEKLNKPVLKNDSGLFVNALKGFLGVYTHYVDDTLGEDGLLKLMEGIEDRTAYFKESIAYCEPGCEPIAFSGPSGAGKTEFIEYLKNKDTIYEEAPGITTRQRREGENGNTFFVSKEEFIRYIENDELIQFAQYNGNYYGTLKSAFEILKYKQVLFNMGLAGSISIKRIRPDSSLIYILPPTKEEVLRRMGNRDIRRYDIGIEQTMNSIELYDYLLISYTDRLDLMYNDFMNIFLKKEEANERSLKLVRNRIFMRDFYN